VFWKPLLAAVIKEYIHRHAYAYAYGIAQCCLPSGRGDIPTFIPAMLVLDLATPEGCKAELT